MFNFYNYISNENEENTLEWTLDLFSRPGMLHQKGLNIFVFSLNKDKEIILKPPKHLFIEDYYDVNKTCIYLFQHSDSCFIEPIILKIPNSDKNITVFDPDNKYNLSDKILKHEQYKAYIGGLNKFIGDWYVKNFTKQTQFPLLTAKQTINVLKQKNIIQIVDSFHKVIYILDENKNLIPVKPSGYLINYKIERFNSNQDVYKYAKS